MERREIRVSGYLYSAKLWSSYHHYHIINVVNKDSGIDANMQSYFTCFYDLNINKDIQWVMWTPWSSLSLVKPSPLLLTWFLEIITESLFDFPPCPKALRLPTEFLSALQEVAKTSVQCTLRIPFMTLILGHCQAKLEVRARCLPLPGTRYESSKIGF